MLRRKRSGAWASPRDAVEFLASVCDGARARDGWGFAAEHVQIGQDLAHTAEWDGVERQWARVLCGVYRLQLTQAGFDVDQIVRGRRRARPAHVIRVAEGWYPDPWCFAPERRWNGVRWTSELR